MSKDHNAGLGAVAEGPHICQFEEEYYGYRCRCGLFYPYGSAPWEEDAVCDECEQIGGHHKKSCSVYDPNENNEE